MNPEGINLTDVWYDIPPVRHTKYKKREGANELSIRLLDRIVEMASEEGFLTPLAVREPLMQWRRSIRDGGSAWK